MIPLKMHAKQSGFTMIELMFAITVLAVASMSTSWMVAETTQGSGKAINLAGSLRRDITAFRSTMK